MGSVGLISVCVNAQSSPWAVPGSGMFVPSPRALSHLWLRLGTLIPPLIHSDFCSPGAQAKLCVWCLAFPRIPKTFPLLSGQGVDTSPAGFVVLGMFCQGVQPLVLCLAFLPPARAPAPAAVSPSPPSSSLSLVLETEEIRV